MDVKAGGYILKQSFFILVVAGALAAGCDARGVNANRGRGGQDAASNPTDRAAGADRNSQRAAANLSTEDQQFVQKAMVGGRKEIELCRVAHDKATSDAVKQLGQRIADDHERANRELESMVGNSDVARAANAKDADETRERLEGMTGEAFDRAYVQEMITDHQKDITEFQRAADSHNQAVRSFAEKTLPTLRQHLQMARDAEASLARGK